MAKKRTTPVATKTAAKPVTKTVTTPVTPAAPVAKPETKEVVEVKAEVKPEPKTETKPETKTTAKKTASKPAAKKEAAKAEIYVQFSGNEALVADVEKKVTDIYVSEGHRASSIKSIKIYIKPEDASAYYVINDKSAGRVDLY